jgi:hypothetical protein
VIADAEGVHAAHTSFPAGDSDSVGKNLILLSTKQISNFEVNNLLQIDQVRKKKSGAKHVQS